MSTIVYELVPHLVPQQEDMTKRRDRGTGSIYREGDAWRGEIVLDGHRHRRRGKTKSEVQDKLNALKRDHLTGNLSADTTTTVEALLTHYLDRVVPNRKGGNLTPTALYRYRWAANHITEQIGRKRVASLTYRDVELMLDRLSTAPYDLSKDSLKKIHGLLKRALENAVKRGDLAKNVATWAELPGAMKEEAKRYSLSKEMTERLIAGVQDDRMGVMFITQILLALRPGEAAALYWSDIDFMTGTVNVTRGRLTDDRGHSSVKDELKTEKAKRTLEAPEVLLDMLKDHMRRQKVERMAAPQWVNDQLVFTTTVGSVIEPVAARRYLARLCKDLDVWVETDEGNRPPLPYELRHTGTSLYSDAGVAQEEIADLMGLSSTRMIEARYRHRLRPAVGVARTLDWGWHN